MVRRIDENSFRWLEPPYTPQEQMLLGGKPSVSRSLHAETFSVSVDATYERYRDLGLSGFDLTFYYAYGSNLLNATVNGKARRVRRLIVWPKNVRNEVVGAWFSCCRLGCRHS